MSLKRVTLLYQSQYIDRPGYGLDEQVVRFPVKIGIYSLCHRVQAVSGALSTSYPMGSGSSFPAGKAAEREDDHSTPSSTKVLNAALTWR